MKLDDKKLIRAIVRRVHPDLFSAHPYERAQNSESLMAMLRDRFQFRSGPWDTLNKSTVHLKVVSLLNCFTECMVPTQD